jgi:hypothetical protein
MANGAMSRAALLIAMALAVPQQWSATEVTTSPRGIPRGGSAHALLAGPRDGRVHVRGERPRARPLPEDAPPLHGVAVHYRGVAVHWSLRGGADGWASQEESDGAPERPAELPACSATEPCGAEASDQAQGSTNVEDIDSYDLYFPSMGSAGRTSQCLSPSLCEGAYSLDSLDEPSADSSRILEYGRRRHDTGDADFRARAVASDLTPGPSRIFEYGRRLDATEPAELRAQAHASEFAIARGPSDSERAASADVDAAWYEHAESWALRWCDYAALPSVVTWLPPKGVSVMAGEPTPEYTPDSTPASRLAPAGGIRAHSRSPSPTMDDTMLKEWTQEQIDATVEKVQLWKALLLHSEAEAARNSADGERSASKTLIKAYKRLQRSANVSKSHSTRLRARALAPASAEATRAGNEQVTATTWMPEDVQQCLPSLALAGGMSGLFRNSNSSLFFNSNSSLFRNWKPGADGITSSAPAFQFAPALEPVNLTQIGQRLAELSTTWARCWRASVVSQECKVRLQSVSQQCKVRLQGLQSLQSLLETQTLMVLSQEHLLPSRSLPSVVAWAPFGKVGQQKHVQWLLDMESLIARARRVCDTVSESVMTHAEGARCLVSLEEVWGQIRAGLGGKAAAVDWQNMPSVVTWAPSARTHHASPVVPQAVLHSRGTDTSERSKCKRPGSAEASRAVGFEQVDGETGKGRARALEATGKRGKRSLKPSMVTWMPSGRRRGRLFSVFGLLAKEFKVRNKAARKWIKSLESYKAFKARKKAVRKWLKTLDTYKLLKVQKKVARRWMQRWKSALFKVDAGGVLPPSSLPSVVAWAPAGKLRDAQRHSVAQAMQDCIKAVSGVPEQMKADGQWLLDMESLIARARRVCDTVSESVMTHTEGARCLVSLEEVWGQIRAGLGGKAAAVDWQNMPSVVTWAPSARTCRDKPQDKEDKEDKEDASEAHVHAATLESIAIQETGDTQEPGLDHDRAQVEAPAAAAAAAAQAVVLNQVEDKAAAAAVVVEDVCEEASDGGQSAAASRLVQEQEAARIVRSMSWPQAPSASSVTPQVKTRSRTSSPRGTRGKRGAKKGGRGKGAKVISIDDYNKMIASQKAVQQQRDDNGSATEDEQPLHMVAAPSGALHAPLQEPLPEAAPELRDPEGAQSAEAPLAPLVRQQAFYGEEQLAEIAAQASGARGGDGEAKAAGAEKEQGTLMQRGRSALMHVIAMGSVPAASMSSVKVLLPSSLTRSVQNLIPPYPQLFSYPPLAKSISPGIATGIGGLHHGRASSGSGAGSGGYDTGWSCPGVGTGSGGIQAAWGSAGSGAGLGSYYAAWGSAGSGGEGSGIFPGGWDSAGSGVGSGSYVAGCGIGMGSSSYCADWGDAGSGAGSSGGYAGWGSADRAAGGSGYDAGWGSAGSGSGFGSYEAGSETGHGRSVAILGNTGSGTRSGGFYQGSGTASGTGSGSYHDGWGSASSGAGSGGYNVGSGMGSWPGLGAYCAGMVSAGTRSAIDTTGGAWKVNQVQPGLRWRDVRGAAEPAADGSGSYSSGSGAESGSRYEGLSSSLARTMTNFIPAYSSFSFFPTVDMSRSPGSGTVSASQHDGWGSSLSSGSGMGSGGYYEGWGSTACGMGISSFDDGRSSASSGAGSMGFDAGWDSSGSGTGSGGYYAGIGSGMGSSSHCVGWGGAGSGAGRGGYYAGWDSASSGSGRGRYGVGWGSAGGGSGQGTYFVPSRHMVATSRDEVSEATRSAIDTTDRGAGKANQVQPGLRWRDVRGAAEPAHATTPSNTTTVPADDVGLWGAAAKAQVHAQLAVSVCVRESVWQARARFAYTIIFFVSGCVGRAWSQRARLAIARAA